MKAMKRFTAMLLLMAVTVTALVGCGAKFDPVKYVRGSLDAAYHADFDELMETTKASQEEAEKYYQAGIDNGMKNFISQLGMDLSDDLKAGYEEAFKKMYNLAKFEVKEAKKDGDNYLVSVDLFPSDVMNVFMQGCTDYVADMVANPENATTDQELIMADLLVVLEDSIANASNGDAVAYEVKVELQDKTYKIPDSQVYEIESKLFPLEQ